MEEVKNKPKILDFALNVAESFDSRCIRVCKQEETQIPDAEALKQIEGIAKCLDVALNSQ